jgi:predicted NAD/FAD-binding protein
LAPRHRVSLFEANTYAGGHTNTVDVELGGRVHPVDTGFVVFNDRTYPNLMALFSVLGVQSYPSQMSFSVSIDEGRLEWSGTDLDSVFAQRRNLLAPRFWGMLRDIARFNRSGSAAVREAAPGAPPDERTLAQLLEAGGYGAAFREHYLLPMAGAIWSSSSRDVLDFPALTFLRFCRNHGLLQIADRPQWRTVVGGGRDYVRRLCAALPDVRLGTPVLEVARRPVAGRPQVQVRTAHGSETFDAVVLATHAPQSLRLLADADEAERGMLGAVRYQANSAVLHTDRALLPRRRKTWSAWNYLGGRAVEAQRPVCVSYLLNRLQALPFDEPLLVTLNPVRAPDPQRVIARFAYDHPLLDRAALRAQQLAGALQGRRHTWFAGAWLGYGFHEDGLKSALRVAAGFGIVPAWASV